MSTREDFTYGNHQFCKQQILADYTSMQTKIPAAFWTDLNAKS